MTSESLAGRTVACLKWGNLYSADHVNRLYAGVRRNLDGDFRFVCFTDQFEGLLPEVEARPIDLLAVGKIHAPSIWVKLALPHPEVGLQGVCLYIDLDVVIWDRIDEFFSYPGEFCIIRNWIERRKRIFRAVPYIGNSSVFRFVAGSHPELAEKYSAAPQAAEKDYPTEQAFLTASLEGELRFWPAEWVRSFKRHCLPAFPLNWICTPRVPKGTRILAFHGSPKPEQAISGHKGAWHKRSVAFPELAEKWIR